MLLARLLGSLPLTCPNRRAHMRMITFVTDAAPVSKNLTNISERAVPPPGRASPGLPAWDDAPEPVPDWAFLGQPEANFESDGRIR